MFQLLERGNILYHQKRFPEAEKEYFKILAQDPNNPFALAMLAQCYLETRRKKEALEFAQRAVRNAPQSPTIYYILARCQFYNQELDSALETIHAGQQLNPSYADFFLLKSQIAFYRENWQHALDEAENGLRLDPEDVTLINLRARALVKLNRKQEAAETMDYALHRAPQSSYSHANKGWVSIEKGAYEEAITHFKEALRLNATNAYAKAGLREGIKAKNFLYRGVLKYFLWLGKLQAKYRWAFVIGIYLLYRIGLYLAETSDLMAIIMTPLLVLYVLFAFSSWIAMPISNLFLRLHPLGKHALEDDEIFASTLVGSIAGLSLFILFLFFITGGGFIFGEEDIEITGYSTLFIMGLNLFLMMIPLGGLFMAGEGTEGRKKLTNFTIILGVLAVLSAFVEPLLIAFFIGVLIYSFTASYLIGKGAKEL